MTNRIPSRRRKRGFSLIETTIALSACGILMSLTIGVLHQTFRLSSAAKSRVEFHASNARLARQFRADAHSCTQASMENDGSLLMKMTDGNSVSYHMFYQQKKCVVRQSQDAAHETSSRQCFWLLDNAMAKFWVVEDQTRAELEVSTEIPGETDSSRIEMRVSATIDRWLQISSRGVQSLP